MKETLPSHDTKSIRIIIVDDDPLIREIYHAKLSRMGNEIKSFSKVEKDFVDQVKAFNPDLVLMDEMLKNNEDTKDIRVIFLTNQSDNSYTYKAKQLGIESYIIKAENTPTQVIEKIFEIMKSNK
jgi:DNA-binding NarL/FixJ family response regulator